MNNITSSNNVVSKYYKTSDQYAVTHPLLKNAPVCQSDYAWVRNFISTYASVINAKVWTYRQVLWGLVIE